MNRPVEGPRGKDLKSASGSSVLNSKEMISANNLRELGSIPFSSGASRLVPANTLISASCDLEQGIQPCRSEL